VVRDSHNSFLLIIPYNKNIVKTKEGKKTMNWKNMTNYELIGLIATKLKYSMQICKRLERTHRSIDFKALESGMSELNVRDLVLYPKDKPKEYYQMQRSFKMYKKSQLMSILMAIKVENSQRNEGKQDEQ
tara:strand:- start:2274 stop:2663 length:390 start_codon:yes stop_codon:yes gene_type:complete